MNILTKKKLVPSLYFVCIFCSNIFAQGADSLINPEQLLFAYNHNTLLASSFIGKARINREYGGVDMKTPFGFGFSFTWLHTYHFNPSFGLETGLQIGGLPIRYRFVLEPYPNVQPYPQYETVYIEHISFPIGLNLRKKIKPKLFLSLHTGVSIRYILAEYLGFGTIWQKQDNSLERLFLVESGFENKFRFTYTLGIGLSRLVWRKDFVNLRLTYTYSPRNIMYGAYIFYPERSSSDPFRTEGTFRTNGSHLGLSVGYTFTKVRKMMKRLKKEKN